MARTLLRSLVCAWTAAAVTVGGCRPPAPVVQTPRPVTQTPLPSTQPAAVPAPAGRPATPIAADAPDGKLVTRIGEAQLDARNATVSELSAAETQALLARMEPLPGMTTASAPIVRPPSAPPPRAGVVQPIAFIAPTGKVIADRPVSDAPPGTQPLAAPQILPVGEVAREAEIRVRFQEAMVPIAAVGTAKTAPATITPDIPGTWRWLDTRVAQFTPAQPRLPQATEFTVRVPAGTRAVNGAVLAEAVTSTFSTPPPAITGVFPTVRLRPDSALLVELDQRIDPVAIAKLLRVEDGKGRKLAFKTVTLDEARARWAKNPSIKLDATYSPHHVILAPATAWPAGIEARVVLAEGAPSLEGPRVSTRASTGRFDVAAPLVARGLDCNDTYKPKLAGVVCPAWGFATVWFSNDLDRTTYRSEMVQLEGEPLDDHTPSGESVTLSIPNVVGRGYAVVLRDGIRDVYGQPLQGARRIAFTTTRMRHDPYFEARSGMYVLDPRFEIPQWIVNAQSIASLRIELYKVEPKDYFAYEDFEAGRRKTPPGTRVYSKEHVVGDRHSANARVDLRPALAASGTGHVIAIATATPAPGTRRLDRTRELAWIQVSRIGVTARIDGDRLHAFAQDITPGAFLKPVSGVATSLLVENRTDAPAPITTDAEGHAAYELLPYIEPKARSESPSALLLATAGADATFAAISGRHEKTLRTRQARWYVTDDRFTYKPGESVYVKGWVRWTDSSVNPDLHLPPNSDAVTYTLTDSRGNRVATGTARFTAQGGFDLEVKLPPNVNLGTGTFSFETGGTGHRHPISIEEFRTPAYSVSLTDDVLFAGARPLVLGESIDMSSEAKYYAGGGLAGSSIEWRVSLSSATYRPPGWDRYTFMRVRPRSERNYWYERHVPTVTTEARETATLSGASTSALSIGIAALPTGAPSILSVDATVTDVDRQRIRASSRPILVHPATLYVGLRVKPETRDVVQAIVTDIDGNAVAGVPVEIAIEGVLGSERQRDDAGIVDTQACTLTSATAPVACPFKRKDDQTAYTAVARIADPSGRANEALLDLPWWRAAPDSDFSVTPDKQTYKPGDVARLAIHSGRTPAVAVVSFVRQGVVTQKRVDLGTGDATVELPIEASYLPNVFVVVDRMAKRRYQEGAKTLPPLPEHDSRQVELKVDVESARLSMRTRPLQPLIEPGDPATFEVEVAHDDKPVAGAEVALIVVDEAILAISGRSHADPLAPFFRPVSNGSWATSTLGLIDDAGSDLAGAPGFERIKLDGIRTVGHGSGTGSGYGVGSGRGGMSGRASRGPTIVEARKDFRPTAVFSPRLTTDASGKVRVTVKMPDNLTRYRVVALATARTRNFGLAESNIVAQRKVNARTVAPRFLTVGDSFSLPVVVQNLDSAPRTIDVAVRAANLTSKGAMGRRVIVPGGQRAEVRFDFATQERGKAIVQTIAVSNAFADASNVEIPVWVPATTESFATYGSVDDQPRFEQLKVPTDVFREIGGLEAELSSTQMQNLTDAFWYLYEYPFECAEQRSGRMLATSAMYDILEAFANPERPTRQEIVEMRANDVKRLARDQRPDGGWGYFASMNKSEPFVSMQVLSALAAQQDRSETTKRAIGYVTKLADEHVATVERLVKARATVKPKVTYLVGLAATALSALAASGVDVTARAVRLHAAATALANYPVDAKARVLSILAGKPAHARNREALLAQLLSVVHETAAAATVAASYADEERLLLVSNTKTTALVLDALLREAPTHALVAKLARGLLDGRKGGRWRTTQENVVVLQALRRYFDVYEKDTPNYTGKLWLGTAAYAEQAFVGRSSARAVTNADWSLLAPGTTHDIALQKTGPGRMYFRLGITYAPKDTKLPPLDAGFIVRRTYKAVDSPSDVVQLPDGTWKIKLGARVLVQLEAINTTLRHAVALVDPMPAGFEAVNTRLATSERAVVDPEADRWDHVNMRDNRSEAFTMQLREGSHRFSYTARATTPGVFIAAPAKAEEMYSPETFGRSAGTTVTIE